MKTIVCRLRGLALGAAVLFFAISIQSCGEAEQSSGGVVTGNPTINGKSDASAISFDNSKTDLTRTTVQEALEEIADLLKTLSDQVATLSGGGQSLTCDTSSVKVLGTCMDTAIQVSASANEFTFGNASDLCENAGKRLCTDAELFHACKTKVINDNNPTVWEWTSAMEDGSKVLQLMHAASNGTGCIESRAVVVNQINVGNVRCCQIRD